MYLIKVILLFFVVFNFPIPIIYNSSLLAVLIASTVYLLHPALLSTLVCTLRNKYTVRLICVFVTLILFGLIPGFLHFTFDFSIIKPYVLTFFLILCSCYIYPILIYDKEYEDRFLTILILLITIFFLQSLIEIAALTTPGVKSIVEFFQKEAVSSKDMGGIRALGLTGNPFFDLAAGFGLIFIVFFYYIIHQRSKGFFSFINVLLFIILFIGSFFAGRTAFVGLGAAVCFYFMSFGNRLQKIANFGKLLLIILSVSFLLYTFLLPDNLKEIVENKLLPYAFEFVYSYLDTGSVSTESGDVLEQMYFPISWETFFLGDGHYTGADGAYYRHTDSGIMRNVLFYGIFGLILILFGHLFYFFKPFQIILSELRKRCGFEDLNLGLFFITILGYTLVLQYKGEVLLFMPIIQTMLFFVCYSFVENNKQLINKQ